MEPLSALTERKRNQGATKMFNRAAIAMIRGAGRPAAAKQFALDEASAGEWTDTPGVYRTIAYATGINMIAVPGVDGGISTADQSLWADASTVFLDEVRAASIVGRIAGARRVTFNKTSIENIAAVGAAWVREGRAIPVSRSIYSTIPRMDSAKVAALIVASSEFATTPQAERSLRAEIRRAVVEQLDRTFIGDGAGDAATPAGIAANAYPVASTGTTVAQITADLTAMVDAQIANGGEPKASVWIVPTKTWAMYRLLKISDPDGGLAGLPVVVSAAATKVTLLAASQLVIAEGDQVQLATSAGGLIEMSDAPAGDIITPTGLSQTPIALFQEDSLALRTTIRMNWTVAGPVVSDGTASVVVLG